MDGTPRYRADHPTNKQVASKTFASLEDATTYAKKVSKFRPGYVPVEYKATHSKTADPLDKWLSAKKAKKDTKHVKCGEVYGYEVKLKDIPEGKQKSNARRLGGSSMKYDVPPEENKKMARLIRNSLLIEPIVQICVCNHQVYIFQNAGNG